MLMVNCLAGFGAGSTAAPAAVTLGDFNSYSDGADQTAYTHTSVNIGANPAASRYLVIAAVGRANANRTISGITVDGVSMTPAQQGVSDTTFGGVFYIAKPSGTTATIVITYSAGMARHAIGVWEVFDLGVHGTGGQHIASTTNFSVGSLTTFNGGVVFGVVSLSANATITWPALNENADTVYPDAAQVYSFAALLTPTGNPGGFTGAATSSVSGPGQLVIAPFAAA